MAEILEYTLVFMVSTLFVGGSIATYTTFSSWASGLQFHEAFSVISGLATQALSNGSSRATIDLPASTIQCHDGALALSSKSTSSSQSFPTNCDFSFSLEAGAHTLAFTERSTQLSLAVS
ncbi:MAG TPA: hypothetical protein VGR56_05955 [Nitrososphaerales archaeon]|nr:hypothetical protein [Nitrososphaerales archaeon]